MLSILSKVISENERPVPDQMCGPVVFYGPKVPSLFFAILRKMSKTSLKRKTNQGIFIVSVQC